MMLLNDEGESVVDVWQTIDSKAGSGNLLVKMASWDSERDMLFKHREQGRGKIGVELSVDDPFEQIVSALPKLDLIVLRFEKFTDGRLFSQAHLIRRRYKFSGELRAAGDIHQDQLAYLRRVGFDSFYIEHEIPTNLHQLPTAAFSEVYQAAADGLTTVRRRRAALA